MSGPQPQPNQKQATDIVAPLGTPPIFDRLEGAFFNQSAPFAGEVMSVSVNLNCESIVAARLEADGRAIAISEGQRADGIMFRRKVHDRLKNITYISQCFVPWANVRGLTYGDPNAPRK